MQQISLSEEYVRSVTKEELKQHFSDNGYDWSDTDIEGYWTKLNPTPAKPEKKTKPLNTGEGTE